MHKFSFITISYVAARYILSVINVTALFNLMGEMLRSVPQSNVKYSVIG